MKNVSHKKGCNSGIKSENVEPPPINLIKETCNGKSYKDLVKLKLCIYPTSSKPDFYEFNTSLFDHGYPEEFLLFIRNFKMNLVATGTLDTDAEIHYICTLVRG